MEEEEEVDLEVEVEEEVSVQSDNEDREVLTPALLNDLSIESDIPPRLLAVDKESVEVAFLSVAPLDAALLDALGVRSLS